MTHPSHHRPLVAQTASRTLAGYVLVGCVLAGSTLLGCSGPMSMMQPQVGTHDSGADVETSCAGDICFTYAED